MKLYCRDFSDEAHCTENSTEISILSGDDLYVGVSNLFLIFFINLILILEPDRPLLCNDG